MPSTDTTLSLPAPAKLNLFLHITGRRADGYHELQTVFQLLDFADRLQFTLTDQDLSLHCNRPELAGDDNLVLRAARALLPYRGIQAGCSIRLEKHIPAGGGLGGGSSDAATTLLALNQLWDCRLEQAQLLQIGQSLGADVPLFVQGHSAWAEGTGEALTALALPERWYLVICPPCAVSTAEIFCHPELTRNSAAIRIPAFPFSGTRNDCEPVACLLYPEIKQALEWLGQFGEARLTGTGACVFAGFTTQAEAESVLTGLPSPMRGFTARGLNRSPVLTALQQMC